MTGNENGSPIPNDPDPDGTTLLTAINDEDIAVAITLAFCYRSWAAYHAGRCAGMDATIEYLKSRVATLEAREQPVGVASNRDGRSRLDDRPSDRVRMD